LKLVVSKVNLLSEFQSYELKLLDLGVLGVFFGKVPARGWFQVSMVPAPVTYSQIRPKSRITNIRYDDTLSFRIFILMMTQLKNHRFESFSQWPHSHIPAKYLCFQFGIWRYSIDQKLPKFSIYLYWVCFTSFHAFLLSLPS
jgi:hypothetical protein